MTQLKSSDRSRIDDAPCAVVVGLDCITGLQTARILAARGVPVIGVANDPKHFCCRTKACTEIIRADTAGGELVEALTALGPRLSRKAVLYPCTDASVLVVSRHRERLEDSYHVVLPDHGIVETLMDKVSFAQHAQEQGLAIPPTVMVASRSNAEQAAQTLIFPCVVKPALKTPRWEQHVGGKVRRVETAEDWLAFHEQAAAWTGDMIIQEWIEGTDADLYSCNCYFNAEGEPVVTFVARKLRQWPPRTGTSSLGEEIRNDEVLEETVRLFRSVGYRGLGYVEMKRDSRTGRHFIVEPNVGRPTGRSAIAEAGGVELLYTKYCDAVGLPLPTNTVQTFRGAKWIYLRHDIQSALHYWRRGELGLREWVRSWKGAKADAVFLVTDQGPFWADLWQCVRLVARQRRQALRRVVSGEISSEARTREDEAALGPAAASSQAMPPKQPRGSAARAPR